VRSLIDTSCSNLSVPFETFLQNRGSWVALASAREMIVLQLLTEDLSCKTLLLVIRYFQFFFPSLKFLFTILCLIEFHTSHRFVAMIWNARVHALSILSVQTFIQEQFELASHWHFKCYIYFCAIPKLHLLNLDIPKVACPNFTFIFYSV